MYSFFNGLSFLQISILLTLSAFLIEKASATLEFTNPSYEDLTAGAPFNVTWSGASGTTTLTLQNGTASSIHTVGVIAFGIQNAYIIWSPYATLPSATYVLRLDDTSGQSAYSDQFTMLASGTKTSLTTGLQFTNPTMQGITAGAPFNVTWSGANGTSTLSLQNGTSTSIATVNEIASGIKNSYILWSPYATTPPGQYVLRLDDSSGAIAYSNMFDMIVKEQKPNVEVSTTITASDSTTTSSSATSSPLTTTASSSPTTTQTSSTQISTPPPTAPSTPSNSDPQPPKAGISPGAKAGIAVGSVIVGLSLIAAVVIFFFRPNKKGGDEAEVTPSETAMFDTHYERDKGYAATETSMVPVEISGGVERIHEMDGRRIDW